MKFYFSTPTLIVLLFVSSQIFCQTKPKPSVKPAETAKTAPSPKKKVPMLENNISVDELKALKAEFPEITVIDVRTKAEIAGGMIPGAVHIEWGSEEFANKMGKLDKNKPYIVYCAVGGRSLNAQRLMKTYDFINVANLSGGYKEYAKKAK